MDAIKKVWIAGWASCGLFLVGVVMGQAIPGSARWMLILIPSGTGHWVVPWPLVLGILLLNVGLLMRMEQRRRHEP